MMTQPSPPAYPPTPSHTRGTARSRPTSSCRHAVLRGHQFHRPPPPSVPPFVSPPSPSPRRHRKITANMQVVMWFAGLRGAIAFALSTGMPGASKDVYASTTLMVVIFTTIGCGGLTEPLLHRMNVKIQVCYCEIFAVERSVCVCVRARGFSQSGCVRSCTRCILL